MSAARRIAAIAACAVAALTGAAFGQVPPAARLSARLQAIDPPAALTRGEAATAILELHNTGTESWPAGGAVRLSYHWRQADGADAGFESPRTPLPAAVPPGGTIRVCALVVAPDTPGPLRLDWELVKEGDAWFGARDPASVLRHTVVIRDEPAPVRTQAVRSGPVALWLLVTLAHLLVSAWWASRGSPHGSPGPAVDARFFDAVLFAVGTLHGVLFLASATTGLPHPRGVAWVAVFDTIVAVALAATRPTTRGDVVASASPPPRTPLRIVAGVLQIAGALALATLAVSWLRVAARSLHVSGSDAAHYHVPHAVNLALGTSPFDLLPTPHLYPMGTSLLGAWFILPFSDPLLIDVAMLAYAALLAASLARAFSAVTGRPGLAWTPWLLLALLSPPLFQLATLFSSDLSFAAAFAAAAAQLLVLGARTPPTIDTRDAIRLGLAFGLLCGVKTTGAPAAVLLLAVAVAGWAVGRWRRHAPLAGAAAEPQPARRTAFALLAIGLAAWLAGGGAWLVRNQVRYGSPIAPSGLRVFGVTIFPGETIAESASYYSVAGDLARPGGYPLGARLSYFVRRWLGPVAGPTALLLVLLLGDVATTRWRRQAPVERDLRLALIVGFAAVTVVFLWLLVHAPWTSLEWTDGLALRYALPILVGAAFVAYLGLFPRQFAWYDDPVTAGAGGAILAGLAVTIFLRSRAALPASLPDAVPGLDTLSLAIAAGGLVVVTAAIRWPALRWTGVAVLAGMTWPVAARLAAHDAALRVDPGREQTRQVGCAAAGLDADVDAHRAIFAALIADEQRRGATCPGRRVFLRSRFDVPLELQTLPYSTRVFDVRQDRGAAALDDAAPCDYLMLTRAELDTNRGAAWLASPQGRAWRPVAERGGFVVFGVQPRQVRPTPES